MRNFPNIRTGVIGTGSMGQNHARVYSEISNFVAVADTDKVQGQRIAKHFGIEWYSDFRKMLGVVDAVSIAVPTHKHRKVAEVVAKSGTHMLVEKPLAGSLEDGNAIIKSAKSFNVKLAVGHIERHNPIVAYSKKAIESGEWGNLITMSSQRVSRYPERIKDVGVVFDLAVHDLDILRYLSDSEIDYLFALGGNKEHFEFEDHISIIMQFRNGIKGICEANWLTPMKVRQLTLTFDHAFVVMDYINQTVEVLRSEFEELNEMNLALAKSKITKIKPKIVKEEPLKLELLDFLSSLESNKKLNSDFPLVTGEDGLAAIGMAEASLFSLRNKVKVKDEFVFSD